MKFFARQIFAEFWVAVRSRDKQKGISGDPERVLCSSMRIEICFVFYVPVLK